MIVDLAAFSADNFDAKAWINAASSGHASDELPEKYLTELEMKLQLLSEDISADLEENSSAALLRIPRAVRETNRVKDDAVSLKGTVAGLLQRLEQAETSSAQSVASLAEIDTAKQNLEAARDTLQYASGLAHLNSTVEDIFASGDLPKIAETLSSMRRCLAVVGDSPEFADMTARLATLEERLDQMVQPRLTDALKQRMAEEASALRDILSAINRSSSVELAFTKVKSRQLRRLWEEFDGAVQASNQMPSGSASLAPAPGTSFAEWLPRFYDEILLATEQEFRWCATAFPGDAAALVPSLITATLQGIDPSFGVRVERILGSLQPGSRDGSKLGALLALHGTTGSFARNLQRLMVSGSTPPQDLVHLLRAAYGPYEPYKQRYGDLERAQLESTVSSMDLRRAAVRGFGQRGVELSAAVRRMEASVPALIVALEASVDRSLDFTGGSESLELVRALDEALSLYISKLLDCLRSLRPVCGLAPAPGDQTKPGGAQPHSSQSPQQQHQQGGGSESGAMGGDRGGSGMGGSSGGIGGGSGVGAIEEEEEWSIIQGTLQLLSVSERLGTRSSMFEASLRASISRLAEKLTSLVHIPTESPPDPQPGSESPSGPGSSAPGGSQSQAGPYAPGGGLGGPGASASAQGQGQGVGGVLSVAVLEKRLVAYVGASTAAGPSSPGGPSSLGNTGGHTPDVDMALVRLASMPEKLQRLKSLIAQSQDPRFHALPRGVQRVQAFRDAVSSLVFEVLLAKVRRQLADVARMPEWGAKEEVNAFDLPSFSAYPLPYITSIGEYLLTLPQQLEPLAVAAAEQAGASLPGLLGPSSPGGHPMEDPSGGPLGGGEDAGGYFVREWMSRVAEGAMALFVEQLKGIPGLSERGAQQLSADIEYLHSVLSVLFVAASPALSTFQACLANPKDQLASFIAAETGPTGALDGPTARLVAKMRGVVVPMGNAGDKK